MSREVQTLNMEFYNFLIKELKQRKGQIPAIGRKAGIRNTTIQNWITGGHIPPVDKAEKVLNAMGYEIQIVPSQKEENNE